MAVFAKGESSAVDHHETRIPPIRAIICCENLQRNYGGSPQVFISDGNLLGAGVITR